MQTLTVPFEPKIILVNGPPRAGKDTVSRILNDAINISSRRFAEIRKFTYPLDRVLRGVVEASYLGQKYTFEQVREDLKDQPVLHDGSTPRQFLIKLSEELFKPAGGPTVLGRWAAVDIETSPCPDPSLRTIIFSDSGFYQEVYGLQGALTTITPDEIVVVQVHRDGCSFENDSRAWLDLRDIGIPLIKLNNSGTLAELEDLCYNLFHDLFIQKLEQTGLALDQQSKDDAPKPGSGDTYSSLGSPGTTKPVTCSGEDNAAGR